MRTLRLVMVSVLLSVTSIAAQAEFVGGVAYGRLSDSGIDLGGLQGLLGYEYSIAENVTLTPEVRFGVGIGDDSFGGASVELGTFYGVNLRAQWNTSSNIYFYLQPSYVNFELEASVGGISASDDTWEFGAGAGVGYQATEKLGFELSYEDFDGASVISAGLRFSF